MLSWLSDLSTTAKVSLAMRTLGLSSDETKAVDDLVSSVGAHPLVVVALGSEYTSLKSVISAGVDLINNDGVSPYMKTSGKLLANPHMRDAVADVIMGFVEKSSDKVNLTRAIEKLAEVPIPGIGDQQYETHREFISAGVLGLASHYLNSNEDDDNEGNTLHQCPLCEGMYYTES